MGNTACCFAQNLIMLSIIASLCLFPFGTCYGGRACNSLGSTAGKEKDPPNPPPAEIQLASLICSYITSLAAMRSYETRNNWYGNQTTFGNICAAANASGQQYGIVFYIGHGNYTEYIAWNGTHWNIVVDDPYTGPIWDRWILRYTSALPPDTAPTTQPVRFAFLWSCYQGATIGGWYNDSTYWGRVNYGMPYAWLHTYNLDSDGYDFPDGTNSTFIGWDEEAPWLIDPITDNGVSAQNASYYFLLNFYTSALYYQKTICQSLDDASAAVWGSPNFANTKFRCGFWYTEPGTNETAWLRMVVYGDGGQKLQ
jgi:hypothetical protein